MTEEQRWRQEMGAMQDRNTCLKGIWEELRNITGMLKILTTVSPTIANSRLSEDDAKVLRNALKQPAQFVPTIKEAPEPPKPTYMKFKDLEEIADPPYPSKMTKEELIEFTKKTIKDPIGNYENARFNGEWHGEQIDPSDPRNK